MPTMSEIAAELGLSRVLVSSVLNNRARDRGVSPKTAERVRQHLARRGFVRSKSALALRLKKRGAVVGVLHTGGLYDHLVDAFNMIVNAFNHAPDRLELMAVKRAALLGGVRELVARGATSLLWMHTDVPDVEFHDGPELLALLANVKTVIYNYRFDGSKWDTRLAKAGVHMVGIDRKKCYCGMGRFLRRLGHRTVALPEAAEDIPSHQWMREALLDSGLNTICARPPGLAIEKTRRCGRVLARSLAATVKNKGATAACFVNDAIAFHTMAGLAALGVRVPEHVGIIGGMGFSSGEIFRAVEPAMTFLRVPVPEMTACAIRLAGERFGQYRHCFDLELVKGKSHARRG